MNKLTYDSAEIGAGLAKAAGKPGWHYRDLPNMLPKLWTELWATIGPENIHELTHAQRKWPDGTVTVRGQLLISPEGMDRLRQITPAGHEAISSLKGGE